MRKLSTGQRKALSEFFNTIAAAWFSGGIVAPFFARVTPAEKMIFFVSGFAFSYIFLNFSLLFVKEIKP